MYKHGWIVSSYMPPLVSPGTKDCRTCFLSGSLTSTHMIKIFSRRDPRFTVFYLRRLKILTVCRWNYKGSNFYSIILRLWVLARPGDRTPNLPHDMIIFVSFELSYLLVDINLHFSRFLLKQEFHGNNDKQSIVKHTFTSPIEARYVRLHPRQYHSNICMRVGLDGAGNEYTKHDKIDLECTH